MAMCMNSRQTWQKQVFYVRSAQMLATCTSSVSLAWLTIAPCYASAIAAIEIFSPGIRAGSFAPCLAGGLCGNHFSHSSFMPEKSSSSANITVTLTNFSSELPAASRMADMFFRHCRVCSCIVSPISFPVSGSAGAVPDTNIKPAALTAWLYVAGGLAALSVNTILRAILRISLVHKFELVKTAYNTYTD